MIVIDSTEARDNTRLPETVINAANIITGFESLTGADILISPSSEPKLPDKLTEALPHRKMLARHTKVGCLAQRKDGRDFVNSIPDLCSIQKRMQDWCKTIPPWLLVIGKFDKGKNDRLRVNGQLLKNSYRSFAAALDFWQLRGGSYTILPDAESILSWVAHWHESVLHKINSEPERLVIDLPPAQALTSSSDIWWTPLIVVPTIGEHKAKVLAEWLPEHKQNLASAICYLCDERNVKGDRPPGFGPKTFEQTRELFGLTDNDIMRKISVKAWEHYPVVVRWPKGVKPGTVGDQWVMLEDGTIEATYNSQEELAWCLDVMSASF